VFLSPSSPWPFFVDDGRSHEHNANHIRLDHSTVRFRFDRTGQGPPATQSDTRTNGTAQIDAVIRVHRRSWERDRKLFSGDSALDDVSVNPTRVGVPDGGLPVSLLGFALVGLTALWRKLSC
jgi:hypothetical protein